MLWVSGLLHKIPSEEMTLWSLNTQLGRLLKDVGDRQGLWRHSIPKHYSLQPLQERQGPWHWLSWLSTKINWRGKAAGFCHYKCVCLQCVCEREVEQGGCHHWQILSPLISCATKAYRVGAGAQLHPWALSGQLGKDACIHTEACRHLPQSQRPF